MTRPLVFIKLPGTSTYVSVDRIISWGPYGMTNGEKSLVYVEGHETGVTVDLKPTAFADYIVTEVAKAQGLA